MILSIPSYCVYCVSGGSVLVAVPFVVCLGLVFCCSHCFVSLFCYCAPVACVICGSYVVCVVSCVSCVWFVYVVPCGCVVSCVSVVSFVYVMSVGCLVWFVRFA